MTRTAYKLVDGVEWATARADGLYTGSAVDRADGYIHMSTAAQLAETARRHYSDRADLVLVEVALDRVGEALRWEASRDGDRFPHLYAPLPFAAATRERGLSVDADGVMRFADGAVGWP